MGTTYETTIVDHGASIGHKAILLADFGLIKFGNTFPRFKTVNVTLDTFYVLLEEKNDDILRRRWWAIPAQDKLMQIGEPVKPLDPGWELIPRLFESRI